MAANVGQSSTARAPSAWEWAQAWRATRRAMAQHFLDDARVIGAALAGAAADRITNGFNFTIQLAVDRVNAEAAARARALAAKSSSGAPAFTPPASLYAGASTLDFENDTITLGDGTVIDMHTGARVDVVA